MYKFLLIFLLTIGLSYSQIQQRVVSATATPANLYGYPYKDSLNTFTMAQTMDSLTVTRLATIDTLNVSTSINLPDGVYKINWGATGSIYSSSGDMWINGNHRFNATGYLVGDGVTGQPFLTKSGTLTNVHYGFYNDYNAGLYRIGADSVSLVTNGTSRFTSGTATNTSTLPLVVSGTTSYVLFPSLTSTERDALTPTAGMVVFNSTAIKLQVYAGGVWVDLH